MSCSRCDSDGNAGCEAHEGEGSTAEQAKNTSEARPSLRKLAVTSLGTVTAGSPVDYFAAFGEKQTQRRRSAAAHYLSGLGLAGLDEDGKARTEFQAALLASPDHLGAKMMLNGIR